MLGAGIDRNHILERVARLFENAASFVRSLKASDCEDDDLVEERRAWDAGSDAAWLRMEKDLGEEAGYGPW